MNRLLASLRLCVRAQLWPLIGVVTGLGFGALVVGHIAGLEPHRTLIGNAPDRVYVSMDCAFSAQALEFLESEPGTRKVMVIPLDSTPTPNRHDLCRPALEVLRREGSILWWFLPDEYACTRLALNARAWLGEAYGEPLEIPLWVVGGEAMRSGTSEGVLTYLMVEGLLAKPL